MASYSKQKVSSTDAKALLKAFRRCLARGDDEGAKRMWRQAKREHVDIAFRADLTDAEKDLLDIRDIRIDRTKDSAPAA